MYRGQTLNPGRYLGPSWPEDGYREPGIGFRLDPDPGQRPDFWVQVYGQACSPPPSGPLQSAQSQPTTADGHAGCQHTARHAAAVFLLLRLPHATQPRSRGVAPHCVVSVADASGPLCAFAYAG